VAAVGEAADRQVRDLAMRYAKKNSLETEISKLLI